MWNFFWIAFFSGVTQLGYSIRGGNAARADFLGFVLVFFFFLESKSWGIDVFSKFGIHQYRSFLKVNARCHVTTNISVLPFPYLSFQGQHLILLFS